MSPNKDKKIKVFNAMQPVKVEIIQDNYTTIQNTK